MDMVIHPFLYFVMKMIPKTRIKSVECLRKRQKQTERATVCIWLCKWTFSINTNWTSLFGFYSQEYRLKQWTCNTNPIECIKCPHVIKPNTTGEKGCKMNYLCTIFIYWNNAFGTCTTHTRLLFSATFVI